MSIKIPCVFKKNREKNGLLCLFLPVFYRLAHGKELRDGRVDENRAPHGDLAAVHDHDILAAEILHESRRGIHVERSAAMIRLSAARIRPTARSVVRESRGSS